jgi:DNA-directed RNA polymerase alpha subunit
MPTGQNDRAALEAELRQLVETAAGHIQHGSRSKTMIERLLKSVRLFNEKRLDMVLETSDRQRQRTVTEIDADDPRLSQPLDTYEWSRNVQICFSRLRLVYFRDLVQKSERELTRAGTGFGLKSMREVKEQLARMGLRLGMQLIRK